MLSFLLCLLSLSYVYGGSQCPPRRNIYPCICIDRPLGRSKFETTVICQGLHHADDFKKIVPGLSAMDIDKFLLYDSFWNNHQRLLQINSRTPVNYPTTLKLTEVKVVDTILSSFGCPQTDNCVTNYLKRFTAINSTVTEGSGCNNPFSISTWISCPGNIEEIEINGGYTTNLTLRPDFFPDQLSNLRDLHMPYNNIIKIERRTFHHSKFPVLQTLDLSHNSLREIKILFSSALRLKYLDLSYNSIRTVVDLQYLPHLKFLNLSSNHIIYLLQNEWANVPQNLRTIDLSGNVLNCNCENKWINSTFHISTNLIGECNEPIEVAHMKLRRASRLLNERCNDKGEILASKIRRTNTTAAPS